MEGLRPGQNGALALAHVVMEAKFVTEDVLILLRLTVVKTALEI